MKNNSNTIQINPLLIWGLVIFGLWLYFRDKKISVTTQATTDPNARQSAVKNYNGSSTHNGTGTATSFSVPHLLGEKPVFVQITPTSGDAGNYDHVEADTKLITVFYKVAPPEGVNNVTFNWFATL